MQKECHPTDQLREETIVHLIQAVSKQFVKESPLLTLSGPFIVVGDLHGNIEFLVRLFQTLHYPTAGSNSLQTSISSVSSAENSAESDASNDPKYLFLGDYVDRGKNSIEVLLLLYALKIRFPTHIYLLRGNHETKQFKRDSSFRTDCLHYLNRKIYKLFLHSFSYMPLCAVVNNVLCLHGGISPLIFNLEDIRSISMPLVDLNGTSAADILWSDPDSTVDYYQDSPRGLGYLFGQDPLGVFLEDNNLKALIRGHQFCHSGYSWAFGPDSDCLTISSSTDYNGTGSSAAVALIAKDGSISIQTFAPLSSESKFRVLFPEWILSCFASFDKAPQNLLEDENVYFVDYLYILYCFPFHLEFYLLIL